MALELKLVDISALAASAPSTPVSLLPYIEALTALRLAGEGKAYALTCSDKTGAKQAKRALIRAGRALSPASGVKFSKLAPVAGSDNLELGFWLSGDAKPARARKTSAERKAAREAKAAKLAREAAGASGEVTTTGEGAPASDPASGEAGAPASDPAPDAPAGEVGNAGDITSDPANAPASDPAPAGKRK